YVPGRRQSLGEPLLPWLSRIYARVLAYAVRRPWTILGVSAAIVLLSFALGARLGSEFLPQLDEGVIWVRANFPAGISLQKSADLASRIREILQSYPEVKLVSSQTGRNDAGTDPYGPNRNEFFLALKPYETWPDGMDKAKLIE